MKFYGFIYKNSYLKSTTGSNTVGGTAIARRTRARAGRYAPISAQLTICAGPF